MTVQGPCWEWPKSKTHDGYGRYKGRTAHRFVYEIMVGPISPGLTLDHLCRNRSCVNPSHLEPVDLKTNVMRGEGRAARNAQKTHCVHGHPFSGANLALTPEGRRRCKACAREKRKRYRQKQREKEAVALWDVGVWKT